MPFRAGFFCLVTVVFTTIGLLAAPDGGHVTLVKGTTAQNGRPGPNVEPSFDSRWTRIYIDDVYVRDAVGRSLDGAADWLKSAKCQSLLSEFADQDGRLLRKRLGALALTLGAYLRILVFEDGERHPPCERPGILAYTAANSRVIRVCGRTFARASQHDPPEGRATIIHEVLHSLGLGENPPKPPYITYRVKQLCW